MLLVSMAVELFGSAFIVFIGTLSRLNNQGDIFTSALVYFFLYSTLISTFSSISGGLFNPMLTFVLFIFKHISTTYGLLFIFSQLCGSVLGAFAAFFIIHSSSDQENLDIPLPILYAGHFYLGAVLEGIILFLLALVFGCTYLNFRTPKYIIGFAMGGIYFVGKLVFGFLSGGAFNFIEVFGPSIVNGKIDSWTFYMTGHFIGAIIGMTVYSLVLREHGKNALEDNEEDDEPRELIETDSKIDKKDNDNVISANEDRL